MPPKDYYIHLEFVFYFPFGSYREPKEDAKRVPIQDIDNHAYPYTKVFIDTLQELKVIKNDDYRYMRGYYAHYMEIPKDEPHRLEVKFHFCTNSGIATRREHKEDKPDIPTLNVYDGPY
jgi:hypothetical protein